MILRTLLFLLIALFSLQSKANQEWRTPQTDNLVYLQLESGMVIIELAPFIAPEHVQRFKNLVAEGFYDDLEFYRVIEGFVAQGGDISEKKPSQFSSPLKAEFTRVIPKNSNFKLIQSPDFIAPETGYLHGFPAGRDPKTNEEWLLHCPGNVAFARDVDINSATTEFYIVIGQATRHLDRNMSSIGKVIYGMTRVQALNRANMNNSSGVIEDENQRSKIVWAKLAKDVPSKDQIIVQVQEQNSAAANKRISEARTLENPFFHFKGHGNLDVCYYQLKSRLVNEASLGKPKLK